MKQCLSLLLALCLLLTACGGGGDTSDPAPTAVGDPFTPYYTDYAVRSMRVTVLSYNGQLGLMGALNNIYDNQAATLYKKLNTAAYRESWLSVPTDVPRVVLTFRPHSDPHGEVYTVFENDLVLVEHPAVGRQLYTAAAGTYYQTTAYLAAVRQEQTRYVTLQGFDSNDQNTAAGYTIHTAKGKHEFHATGTDVPQVDMVGEGLVRVYFRETCAFYDTAKGNDAMLATQMTDVAGGYVAAANQNGISLYPLLSEKAAARVYAAQDTIQGLSFSEDGSSLHVLGTRGDAEAVWDSTLPVAALLASTRYYVGVWETAPDATEKQQQTVGYALLKKLRHKEKELGRTLSALPQKRLDLDGKVYFLTEIGSWEKVDGEYAYTAITYLLVDEASTVAYEVTKTTNELSWDTKKNWIKK